MSQWTFHPQYNAWPALSPFFLKVWCLYRIKFISWTLSSRSQYETVSSAAFTCIVWEVLFMQVWDSASKAFSKVPQCKRDPSVHCPNKWIHHQRDFPPLKLKHCLNGHGAAFLGYQDSDSLPLAWYRLPSNLAWASCYGLFSIYLGFQEDGSTCEA